MGGPYNHDVSEWAGPVSGWVGPVQQKTGLTIIGGALQQWTLSRTCHRGWGLHNNGWGLYNSGCLSHSGRDLSQSGRGMSHSRRKFVPQWVWPFPQWVGDVPTLGGAPAVGAATVSPAVSHSASGCCSASSWLCLRWSKTLSRHDSNNPTSHVLHLKQALEPGQCCWYRFSIRTSILSVMLVCGN